MYKMNISYLKGELIDITKGFHLSEFFLIRYICLNSHLQQTIIKKHPLFPDLLPQKWKWP